MMNKKWILFFVSIMFAIPVAASEGFVGNKCYDDWTFCGDGTTPESQFNWECGWYVAAFEAGATPNIPNHCSQFAVGSQAQQANGVGGGSQTGYASGSSSGHMVGQNPSGQTGGQNPSGQTGDQNPSGQTDGGVLQHYELVTSGPFAGMYRYLGGACS